MKAPIESLNLALLVGAGVLSTAQGFQASLLNAPPTAIEIRAEAIPAFDPHDPARQRFGQLEFRGGLILKSTYQEFGGLSAIRFLGDGKRFISLSDHGRWFTGSITYDGGTARWHRRACYGTDPWAGRAGARCAWLARY